MGQRITDRQRAPVQQGAGADRDAGILRHRRRADRGADPSRKPGPRAGRLSRRRADGASRPARHAPRHRLCAELAASGEALPVERLDLAAIGSLTFRAPDERALARAAPGARGDGGGRPGRRRLQRRQGGGARRLPRRRIGFPDMAAVVEEVLAALSAEDALQVPRSHLITSRTPTIWRGSGPRRARGRDGKPEDAMDLDGTDPAPSAGRSGRWPPSSWRCRSSSRCTNTAITSSGAGRASDAEVFSLGFGPVLFSRVDRRGHALAGRGAAARRLRQVPRRRDAASAGHDAEALQAMTEDTRRRTMHGAPLWARAATVAAGPVFNFVLSILVFAAILMLRGVAAEPLTVDELRPCRARSGAAAGRPDPGDRGARRRRRWRISAPYIDELPVLPTLRLPGGPRRRDAGRAGALSLSAAGRRGDARTRRRPTWTCSPAT